MLSNLQMIKEVVYANTDIDCHIVTRKRYYIVVLEEHLEDFMPLYDALKDLPFDVQLEIPIAGSVVENECLV